MSASPSPLLLDVGVGEGDRMPLDRNSKIRSWNDSLLLYASLLGHFVTQNEKVAHC